MRDGRAAFLACLIAALLLGWLSGPAYATPLTAAQVLSSFNLVVTGNDSTSSDVEGSAVIGGDLTGSATFFNNHVPVDPVVYLYGANAGQSNIDGGGRVSYGSNPGSFNLNGAATAERGGLPRPLSDYVTPLADLSRQLHGLTANSVAAANSSGAFVFDATPDSSGIAVFALSADALQSDLQNMRIAVDQHGATGIIINVSGSFTEPSGTNWTNGAVQDVLFNFYDATSVVVGNWEGSILAPNASVGVANGAVEGSVFAQSFLGGGELHNLGYAGTLPPVSSQPVPEPGTLLLVITGIGALALSRHASRRARRATRGSP